MLAAFQKPLRGLDFLVTCEAYAVAYHWVRTWLAFVFQVIFVDCCLVGKRRDVLALRVFICNTLLLHVASSCYFCRWRARSQAAKQSGTEVTLPTKPS